VRIQLRIYDRSGVLVKILQNEELIAINFSVVLNDVGVLAFTLPYDESRYPLSIFPLDTLAEVYIEKTISAQALKVGTYMIRQTQIYREKGQPGEYLVFGALDLNHFLHRRVIDPADDPVAADSFVTRAGDAVQVMRDYAYYQLGEGASVSRRIPGLTVTMVGTGQYVAGRYRYDDNLFDIFEELSYKGKSDFYVQRTTANNFELVIGRRGSDKTYSANFPFATTLPVVFDPRRGNLIDPELEIDRRDEVTYFYGMGEGQNAGQDIYRYPMTARIDDSPYNRIETTADTANGDNQEYTIQRLITETVLKANKLAPKQTLKFELPSYLVTADYKVIWDIGDDVTVYYKDFQIDMRIQSVEFKLDGRKTPTVEVEIKERRIE